MGDLFGLVGSIALIIAGLAFMGMSKLSTLINGDNMESAELEG